MGIWLIIQEHTSHSAGDQDVSCRWLLTVGGGSLAGAIFFLVLWLKEVLKELREEQTGRLNDLKEQFRSMKNS